MVRCDPQLGSTSTGGSAFRNLIHPAEGALIRAAASTQPLGRREKCHETHLDDHRRKRCAK